MPLWIGWVMNMSLKIRTCEHLRFDGECLHEFLSTVRNEPLPGSTGNKGMAISVLEKHISGNREHQNRRNTFREHGNTRKILLGTREHALRPPPPPPPPPLPWEGLRNIGLQFLFELKKQQQSASFRWKRLTGYLPTGFGKSLVFVCVVM